MATSSTSLAAEQALMAAIKNSSVDEDHLRTQLTELGDSLLSEQLLYSDESAVHEVKFTLTHAAALHGRLELLRDMHAREPSCIQNLGKTQFKPSVLHCAAKHTAVLEQCVEWGMNIGIQDTLGSTVLHYAAYHGCVDSINWILDQAPYLLELKTTVNGFTALQSAASQGQIEACKALLKRGAEQSKTLQHRTPAQEVLKNEPLGQTNKTQSRTSYNIDYSTRLALVRLFLQYGYQPLSADMQSMFEVCGISEAIEDIADRADPQDAIDQLEALLKHGFVDSTAAASDAVAGAGAGTSASAGAGIAAAAPPATETRFRTSPSYDTLRGLLIGDTKARFEVRRVTIDGASVPTAQRTSAPTKSVYSTLQRMIPATETSENSVARRQLKCNISIAVVKMIDAKVMELQAKIKAQAKLETEAARVPDLLAHIAELEAALAASGTEMSSSASAAALHHLSVTTTSTPVAPAPAAAATASTTPPLSP